MQTSQSPRVKMNDYKRFSFVKDGLTANQKINLRNNILKTGKPIDHRQF